jgi:hypothetical protein
MVNLIAILRADGDVHSPASATRRVTDGSALFPLDAYLRS